jgi:hypothetical protein
MNAIELYLRYYEDQLFRAWDNLTLMQYATILIAVALIGWVLMKRGADYNGMAGGAKKSVIIVIGLVIARLGFRFMTQYF